MALICLLKCETSVQAQYGPCSYNGWWMHQCATADEAYLTGWSRVFSAWGEANYLNSLAACGYQQAKLMELENRGRFLTPYTQQTALSSVGPAAVAFEPTSPLTAAIAPLGREAGSGATPAAQPEQQVVYRSPHQARRVAEQNLRKVHAAQNFRHQTQRHLDAQLAAQALAARLESSGGKVAWPPLLLAARYQRPLQSIDRALRAWSTSTLLSGHDRSALRQSLNTVQKDLAKRQRSERSSEIVAARTLLSQIETLTLGYPETSGSLLHAADTAHARQDSDR